MHIFLVREMGLNTIQCYPYTKVSKNRKPGMHQFGRSVEGPNTIRPYQLQKDRKKNISGGLVKRPNIIQHLAKRLFLEVLEKGTTHHNTIQQVPIRIPNCRNFEATKPQKYTF